MAIWIPEAVDLLAAILGLACRGNEQLNVSRVYSVLNELKGREALLSGLYFSITGAVCYSRQVEETLRSLVERRILVRKGSDTLVVREEAAEEVRARLRKKLPSSVYRALQSASKRFYRGMFRRREGRQARSPA